MIGAIALFASEKVRIDLVALIVLVLLVGLGIVSPGEALAGFSNEATVTVAAMFALSLGIERSGALEPLGRALARIRKPWLLTLALMLAIAPMGAFVKNIALVATFLPLALRVCARTRHIARARADADGVRGADGRRVHADRHLVEPARRQPGAASTACRRSACSNSPGWARCWRWPASPT